METHPPKKKHPLFGVILVGCIFGGLAALQLSLVSVKQRLDNIETKLPKRKVVRQTKLATAVTAEITPGVDVSAVSDGKVLEDDNRDNEEDLEEEVEEDVPPE